MKWWIIYSNNWEHFLAAPDLDPAKPKFSLVAMGWPLDWLQSIGLFLLGLVIFIVGFVVTVAPALAYLTEVGAFIMAILYFSVGFPTLMYWLMRWVLKWWGYEPIAKVAFIDTWEGSLSALETHKYYAVIYALNLARGIVNNPHQSRFIPLDKNYYNKLANVLSSAIS